MIPVRPTRLDLQLVDRRAAGFQRGQRISLGVEHADGCGVARPVAALAFHARRTAPHAGRDAALAHITRPIAVCADESIHDRASLAALRDRYDAVNIKLDKTGGLTEAMAMADAAQALGFEVMVGCMVATSLAMAPAMLVAQRARYVDLDGPLLLAKDREDGLRYDGSTVYPPDARLWG